MTPFPRVIWLAICVVLLAESQPGLAHDSQPLLVQIDEQSPSSYRVKLKLPPSMRGHRPPELVLPKGCESIAGTDDDDELASTSGLFRCPRPIEGSAVRITFSDFNPSLAIFFRLKLRDGQVLTSLQPPDGTEWLVPPLVESGQADWSGTIGTYTRLGIEHILTGFDHLLFVTCLLMIAGSARRILLAVTGFTVAHSLTLGMAAFEWVRIPPLLVEALIALSIVVLAAELVRRDKATLAWRYPIAMAMAFGLLHGFGFAAVLGEIGLPNGQRFLALFAFNLGVEVGQAVFVLLFIALLQFLRATFTRREQWRFFATSSTLASYVIGTIASFWLIQRMALF